MEAPSLEIPSLQELRNQPEEPLIMELLLEYGEHHRMLSAVETLRNVALNEPLDVFPVCRDLPQRRVTAAPTTEPMCVRTALRFVVCLPNGAYDVLEHLIGPGREPERA